MKDSSAIPIIINKSSIENNLVFAPGFDDPEAVPHLELNDYSDIIVASGQHHISAVKRYCGLIEEEMESYQTRHGKLGNLKTLTDEAINEHNTLGDQIAECMGQLDGMGKWGVIVYDKSKLLTKSDGLANHLSRNNALHKYKEIQEEVLITMLKSIQLTYLANPDDIGWWNTAVALIEELWAKMDKNSQLQKVMHSPNITLQRIFGNLALQVNGYLHGVAALQDLHVLLEKSTPNHGGGYLWAGVMDDLDWHAKTAFEERKKVMQKMTPKYITRLSTYRQNVLKTLEKAWLRTGRGAGELNEIDWHLDHSMVQVLLSLTALDGDTYTPEPLLSAWLLDYIWDELAAVENGIAEVMIHNIEKDCCIEQKEVSMDVCCLIWQFRDTLVLHLHNQAITAINTIPERPTNKHCQASRDMSEEAVAGTMAIHMTAWDWNTVKLENFGRDQAPFVQVIILERKITGKYQSQLLSDPIIASFQKTLETTLTGSARKIQTMGDDDKLVPVQEWTWWDELALPGKTVDAHTMKNSMQGTDMKVEQHLLSQDVVDGLIALLKSTHSMTEDITEELVKVMLASAEVRAEIPSMQQLHSVITGKTKANVSQDGPDPQTSGMEPVEQAHASSSDPLQSHAKPKPQPVPHRSLLAAEKLSSMTPFKETAVSLSNDMDVIADVPNIPCLPAADDGISSNTFATSSDDGSALIAQGMSLGDHGWYQPTPSQHSSNDRANDMYIWDQNTDHKASWKPSLPPLCPLPSDAVPPPIDTDQLHQSGHVLTAAHPHGRPVAALSNVIMTVTTASSSKRPCKTTTYLMILVTMATHTWKKKSQGMPTHRNGEEECYIGDGGSGGLV
ncbi:uncharacterized protein BJ212DRAFT_1299107 [Suillus subaureus]|uniref:Uncharacterized protein n=1 Tax=Suillus subaureus TaxID=48587 RepID=A0A9P7ED13_9AGAM|nr:uncharacterized protein BJ212DRAFT_1299107 [Suillus subaureus]KAG1817560.1 hypothetical protein BJ212DRAFT_1299107 [Suillus subaureus]